ncbi:hypothetical protein BH09SUM1_BH09SUM1_09580 [soil metagenome]
MIPRIAKWEWLAVAVILFIAGVYRIAGLAENPPGLFRDEAEKGYTALELWKTGRHGVLGESGITVSRPMPLFIEVYEGHDRTSALYQYLTAPIVGIWGLTVRNTRLVSAISGIGVVLLLWVFARFYFDAVASLTAMALMAVQPTHVLFSRWAQQGSLVPLFVLLGFVLLEFSERGPERLRRALSVLGGLSLGLAAYAYDPARVVVPLLLGGWLLSTGSADLQIGALRSRSGLRRQLPALLAFTIIWIPLVIYTLTAGSSRLGRVGIGGNGALAAITTFASNSAAHFSPMFLFITGDSNQRHSMPGNGLFGFGGGILAAAGAVLCVIEIVRRVENRRIAIFLLCWLLAAPVAAAMTREGIPHALRANLLLEISPLLAAVAVQRLKGSRRALILGAVLGFCAFAVDGSRTFRGLRALNWETPDAVWENGLQYAISQRLWEPGQIWISPEIPYASYAMLFAEKTDPDRYHEMGLDALRSRIAPSAKIPPMQPGDAFIGFPHGDLDQDLLMQYVLIYKQAANGIDVQAPRPEM